MNTATHTPTPWIVFDASARYPGIDGQNDTTVVVHGYDGEACGVRGSVHATALANAAFIVRACNAHDELVAALKEARNQMLTNRECAGKRQSNERVNMTSAALLQIERALAKAGV